MAYLSLGLQNDEPPISSEQGEKKPSVREEYQYPSSGVPLHSAQEQVLKAGAQPVTLLPQNTPMPPFLSNHGENGNGHRPLNGAAMSDSPESDDFDDRFDDADAEGSDPAKSVQNVLGDAHIAAPPAPSNGNGRVRTPTAIQSTQDGRAETPVAPQTQ